MIYFSVGLPCRFTDWCDTVTRLLVEQARGKSAAVVNINTLEDFALGVIGAEAPVLVISRQLGRLQKVLARGNKRVVVALDDPRLTLEALVEQYGIDFADAVRAVASSCASMVGCAALPEALVLSAEIDGADAAATAQAIARHLDLAVAEHDIANIVAYVAHFGLTQPRAQAGSWWERLDEERRRAAAGALDPYIAHFAGGELGSITWERHLFLINEEQPAEERRLATRPVDVTGRPRPLVHGPYVALPAGSWSATIALGFSSEAAEMNYVIDVYGDRQLASIPITPKNERTIEVDLHFAIDEPLDQPIVIRVSNERAAFDGRLALGYVTLTPHASLRRETRDYFTAALSEEPDAAAG